MSELSELYWHGSLFYLVHQLLLVFCDFINNLPLILYYLFVRYFLLSFLFKFNIGKFFINAQCIYCLPSEIPIEAIFKINDCRTNQCICISESTFVIYLNLKPPVLREACIKFVRPLELGVQILWNFFVSVRYVFNLLLLNVIFAVSNNNDWEWIRWTQSLETCKSRLQINIWVSCW